MNLVDAFSKQPKSWMLAEALLFIGASITIDLITPWHFSMFVFYAVPVFLIAQNFPQRAGISFAIFVAVIGTAANRDSIHYRGLGGYIWSGINRQCAMLFVAACAISIQRFREATRRRIEAMEHARELEREIVRAGEREQMRIGQDLHDGVCQSLAALDCAAQCLKMDLEMGAAPQAKLAAEIQRQLSAAMIEARNLARGIYPVTMERDGLSVALQGLVLAAKALTSVQVVFETDENVIIKDPEVAMHLYRIAQEALSNAMRHANASQVVMRLTREDHRLTVCVEDDGCGSGIQSPADGMGWRTMRYRANLIGAELDVTNSATGGTAVRCLLPIPSRPC
jgi:signal transduction histidine kinase